MYRECATPFLEAGLPVFIDKPFASTTEELIEVVAFQEAALAPREVGGRPIPLPR